LTLIDRVMVLLFGSRFEQEKTYREISDRLDQVRESYAERLIEEGKRDIELGKIAKAQDVVHRGRDKVRLGESLIVGEAGLMQAMGFEPEDILNGEDEE
jgi:hypothetical protein